MRRGSFWSLAFHQIQNLFCRASAAFGIHSSAFHRNAPMLAELNLAFSYRQTKGWNGNHHKDHRPAWLLSVSSWNRFGTLRTPCGYSYWGWRIPLAISRWMPYLRSSRIPLIVIEISASDLWRLKMTLEFRRESFEYLILEQTIVRRSLVFNPIGQFTLLI